MKLANIAVKYNKNMSLIIQNVLYRVIYNILLIYGWGHDFPTKGHTKHWLDGF